MRFGAAAWRAPRMEYSRMWLRNWSCLLASLAMCTCQPTALADSITFGGSITQSTSDGTGSAANNPTLNNIADGDTYSVVVNFPTSITSTGTYALAPGSLTFSDPSAPATESSFGMFLCGSVSSIACLAVTADGSFDDISLL